jgi:23S rRNA A1618 N6-methylase RlmF
MVGVDVTEVALEWAQRHIDNNPQLAGLLELRRSRAKVGDAS